MFVIYLDSDFCFLFVFFFSFWCRTYGIISMDGISLSNDRKLYNEKIGRGIWKHSNIRPTMCGEVCITIKTTNET